MIAGSENVIHVSVTSFQLTTRALHPIMVAGGNFFSLSDQQPRKDRREHLLLSLQSAPLPPLPGYAVVLAACLESSKTSLWPGLKIYMHKLRKKDTIKLKV